MEYIKRNKLIAVISPNTEKYENEDNQIQYGRTTISRQLIIDIIKYDDYFDEVKKLNKLNTTNID